VEGQIETIHYLCGLALAQVFISVLPAPYASQSHCWLRNGLGIGHGGTTLHFPPWPVALSRIQHGIHSTRRFRIKQTHALGGSGLLEPKWPETNDRISKKGSTAFTMSLAVRCGGPGPTRFLISISYKTEPQAAVS
jgi:hypothetical protein